MPATVRYTVSDSVLVCKESKLLCAAEMKPSAVSTWFRDHPCYIDCSHSIILPYIPRLANHSYHEPIDVSYNTLCYLKFV